MNSGPARNSVATSATSGWLRKAAALTGLAGFESTTMSVPARTSRRKSCSCEEKIPANTVRKVNVNMTRAYMPSNRLVRNLGQRISQTEPHRETGAHGHTVTERPTRSETRAMPCRFSTGS